MFNIVFESRNLLTAMPADTCLGTFIGANVDPFAMVPTNYAPQIYDPLNHSQRLFLDRASDMNRFLLIDISQANALCQISKPSQHRAFLQPIDTLKWLAVVLDEATMRTAAPIARDPGFRGFLARVVSAPRC